jgi:hypothetical protein
MQIDGVARQQHLNLIDEGLHLLIDALNAMLEVPQVLVQLALQAKFLGRIRSPVAALQSDSSCDCHLPCSFKRTGYDGRDGLCAS